MKNNQTKKSTIIPLALFLAVALLVSYDLAKRTTHIENSFHAIDTLARFTLSQEQWENLPSYTPLQKKLITGLLTQKNFCLHSNGLSYLFQFRNDHSLATWIKETDHVNFDTSLPPQDISTYTYQSQNISWQVTLPTFIHRFEMRPYLGPNEESILFLRDRHQVLLEKACYEFTLKRE